MNVRLDHPGIGTDRAVQLLAGIAVAVAAIGLLVLLRATLAGTPGHHTVQIDNQTGLELRVEVLDASGAAVSLAGSYALRPEMLDFSGTLRMDAKVSETQTGFKRVLLKVVDPLFKEDGGGSAIPIKVVGPRNNPSFGLDKGRVFHRGK